VLSVVLGYDLGRGWRVGGRFFYESGRPYQVGCPTAHCAPEQTPAAMGVYTASGTLPPFYRVDARLEKRWTFAGSKWLAATLECFNALDKAEPTGATYVPAEGIAIRSMSPIILPSVGVEGGL
jgi:hypothetical protein